MNATTRALIAAISLFAFVGCEGAYEVRLETEKGMHGYVLPLYVQEDGIGEATLTIPARGDEWVLHEASLLVFEEASDGQYRWLYASDDAFSIIDLNGPNEKVWEDGTALYADNTSAIPIPITIFSGSLSEAPAALTFFAETR